MFAEVFEVRGTDGDFVLIYENNKDLNDLYAIFFLGKCLPKQLLAIGQPHSQPEA